MWLELSLFLCVAWLAHWIQWRGFLSKLKHPPSFYGLPFAGIMPYLLFHKNHVTFAKEISEKYGPVFRFRLGTYETIMVNGSETVKEVLRSDDFLGRPSIKGFQLLARLFNASLFMMMEGEKWRDLRSSSVQALRELGFGKTPKMEAKIQDELSVFVDELTSTKGAPYDPKDSILASVSNNISTLIFGDRLPYDDPKRRTLNEFLTSVVPGFAFIGVFTFFPSLVDLFVFLKLKPLERLISKSKEAFKIFEAETESHKERFSETDKRDFMDFMIAHQQTNPELFTAGINRGSYLAFFVAGSTTTRIAVEYLMLLMAAFPQLQEQIYQEIRTEIGDARLPTWADHEKLHLVNAFIAERLRIFPIVPFGIFRRALRDSKIQGYDVKKGTLIIYNTSSVHFDASVFKSPEEFNPARFLDSSGTFVPSNDIISFAIGKRACPGESFAVFEIFLYFTAIAQRFRVEPVDGVEVNLHRSAQFFSEPVAQKLRFISRT